MIEKIDISAGKFTYAQRIELGKILTNIATHEIEKLKQTIRCLHGFELMITPDNAVFYADYFEEILEGVLSWIEKEKMLQYKPTPEEVKAGIKDLSEKIGDFGTIKALAKEYNRDPDEILQWEYGKVFGILYTDYEQYKFQK